MILCLFLHAKLKFWTISYKIWSLTDFECVETLIGHTGSVQSIVLLPDDVQREIIASSSSDCTIKLWETKLDEDEDEWFVCERTLTGHTSSVLKLVLLPGKQLMASGSQDKTIRFWDLATYGCVRVLTGNIGILRDIVILENQRMASLTWDSVQIWDLSIYECLGTLTTEYIKTLLPLPGNKLATGDDDQGTDIKIWDLSNFKCVHTLRGHENSIAQLMLLPENTIQSVSIDGTLKIWNWFFKLLF